MVCVRCLAKLRAIPGIEVIEGDTNAGFAANVNRGIRAADPKHDVVVLNSDIIAERFPPTMNQAHPRALAFC